MSAHDQALKYSSFPSIERKALSHALFDYGKSAFQDPAIQEEYRQWQERKMSVQSGQTESAHQLRNETFTVILSSHTNEIEVLEK